MQATQPLNAIAAVIGVNAYERVIVHTTGRRETQHLTDFGWVSADSITKTTLATSELRDRVRRPLATNADEVLAEFPARVVEQTVKDAVLRATGFSAQQFEGPWLYEAVKRKASRDKNACIALLAEAYRYKMFEDTRAVLEAARWAHLQWCVQGDEASGPSLDVEVPNPIIPGRELRVQLLNFLRALSKAFWQNQGGARAAFAA